MDASPPPPSDPGPALAAEAAALQRHLVEGIYALSLARTAGEAHRVLLGRAAEILPSSRWLLGEPVGDGLRMRLAATLPSPGPGAPPASGVDLAGVFDAPFVQEVCAHHRTLLVGGGAPSDLVPPGTAGARQGLLGLPLVFEGRLMGILLALGPEEGGPFAPSGARMAILQSLGRIAALALERLQAEARLGEAATLSRGLAQGVRDLAEATDEEALVDRLFQWAAKLAPLQAWWFNRYDPETRTCTTTHWTPSLEAYGPREAIQRPDPVDGNPLLERVHLRQEAILVSGAEDPSSPQLARWDWLQPFHTWVGLPLVHRGSVAGSLSGGAFGPRGPVEVSPERFESLQSLAEAAGLALNRLQARRALEAEETRFRLLFEQSPDPIALLARGRVLDMNQAAADLLGRPRQALLGLGPLDLSPGRQPSGEPSLQVAMALLGEVKAGLRNRFEWTFLDASGREIPCEVGLTQYRLDGHRIYHAVLRDLTAQKHAEAERTALERQLFQAQKLESLGVLAGGIAHDFNNLLMGVLGHAGLALEQLNPLHPARRNLEAIQKAGQRAADLTRQMLAYSGRGQFVVRHLDLTVQVEEMVHLLEVSLPKTVVLHLDLKRDLPAVTADASQVQQVIMNLVINAAEAIGEAPGAITLATGLQRLEQPGGHALLVGQDVAPGLYVCLEVTDTGCGMDPGTVSRIFEPFFTTKFTGRGLGLSAIMGIVRGHKGALRVYSEPGRGTTFKVLFPAQEATVAAAVPEEAGGAWTSQGLVLVVDDDETVRAVAREALERRGFQVLEAGDGVEGVAQVRQHGSALSLVLLDMTMPRMDGETAFREMRALHPELRVILSSGYSEVEAMGRFLGKGLRGFIQKPYGPKDLVAKVQSALGDRP